jgi:hypothetical protein
VLQVLQMSTRAGCQFRTTAVWTPMPRLRTSLGILHTTLETEQSMLRVLCFVGREGRKVSKATVGAALLSLRRERKRSAKDEETCYFPNAHICTAGGHIMMMTTT